MFEGVLTVDGRKNACEACWKRFDPSRKLRRAKLITGLRRYGLIAAFVGGDLRKSVRGCLPTNATVVALLNCLMQWPKTKSHTVSESLV
jgi:hypothetical protein